MKRGWCPTLDAPMRAADGWLVRVRPPLGRLTAEAACRLADAAERWGNGRMELTSHANIQVRGIRDVPAFAAACGLPSPPGRVVVSPLAGDDPDCAAGTLDAAAEVEARLARTGVPRPKYTVVVDGGGALGLEDVPADERVVLGPPGRSVRAGVFSHRGGQGFAFGLPFGELPANGLRSLAGLSAAHADGALRLTPWRCLLLARARCIDTMAVPPGVIADLADPVLYTAACVGSDGCARGTVPARADARRFARPGLHVSGCAKGCAHPGPAALTLVGRDGRYDLVRNGAARDPPTRRGLRP